ncbi:AsmA family protein [Roseovarius litorisediminis]|uniref:AsmA family protein n=1 Tax=Roseovarius litorisediminis TaxID=1312363 RepID=A0A1Y5R5S1_9RHOB|nr:AsmA family protein [Roseovarius litorisediminis]SLN09722.1 AsmA family protein [Roseovarius litorisediminis]
MSDNTDQKPHRGRGKRIGLWAFWILLVVCCAGAIGVYSAIGKQISAPEYLRKKIVDRANTGLHGITLAFGDVAVVLSRDLVPRLVLQNVRVHNNAGATLLNLSDVQSTVALKPLLKGQLQPASIRLSGAQLRLRRAANGTINIALGEAGSWAEETNLAAMIERIDAVLLQPQFATLDSVTADSLTMRYEDVRADRTWIVDGGRMSLTRKGDDLQIRADFSLLGARDYATTLEMNYAGRIGELAANVGFSFEDMPTQDIAGQSPALAWLGALDAPISGALRASIDGNGELGPLNAALQIGAGVLQPTPETKPIAFTSARSYFTYDPKAQRIQFNDLSLVSKWVTAQAEGQAILLGMESGWPEELLAQIRVSEIKANPDNLYPEPISIDAATMDMRLHLDPFLLSLGEMSFADQGRHLVLNGKLGAEAGGWNLALNGRMDALTPERLLQLWPQSVKEKTRNWIGENVVKAALSNIQVAVRSLPQEKPSLFLGFDYEALETRFIKKVPHITGASGHGSLYDDRFVISADKGFVTAAQGGRIAIDGTSFIIPVVRVNKAPARVRLQTDSTITAALSLLDEEPFQFLSKAGQPVTLADGRAQLKGRLDFLLKPKLQPDEVAFDVAGKLSGVRSETLVEGRVLAASELAVTVNNTRIEVGGVGRIGRVPFTGKWQTRLGKQAEGKSAVTGKIELSEQFADEFSIGLPPGSISGSGSADFRIDLVKDNPGRFVLKSDLSGVGLSLRQLDWSLPQSTRGSLEVSGRLGKPPAIDLISLDAGGMQAQGTVSLKSDGQLDRAKFSRVAIGTWLSAPVELIGRGPGAAPAVRVSGGMIDLRQTSLSGDGSGRAAQKRGGPVTLSLDRLQVSDGIALQNFQAELDMSRGVDGNFSGKVNGGAEITGRVVPRNGRSAFRIQSINAGAVMSSAGMLKKARNGDMDLVLIPAPEPGSYDGQLKIMGIRLKNAPALGALLNAISVVGLLQQLDGEGIHFSEVDARFRLTPERVTLLSGSGVGASIGISMDGYYFLESGRMDMQGVISPIYLVNAIGGMFTRKGEGLIGFNYNLKGTAANPRVQVNPLSALTPGLFREIFRRPAPTVSQERGGAPQPIQPQQPEKEPEPEQDVSR